MAIDRTIQQFECPDNLVAAIGRRTLYAIGNAALLDSKSIGICGSRHGSPRGLERAREFGREAALKGTTVVSGYARGVDREAHLGALEAGGSTIAVLPESM